MKTSAWTVAVLGMLLLPSSRAYPTDGPAATGKLHPRAAEGEPPAVEPPPPAHQFRRTAAASGRTRSAAPPVPGRPQTSPPSQPAATATAAARAPQHAPPAGNALPPLDADRPAAASRAPQRHGLAPVTTALSALAVAVGLFLLVAWLVKRKMPAAARPLPTEVLELLGRAPLADRQYVHLLRLGSKLLLVSVSSAGAETLTEIIDPDEVDRLAGLCKQVSSGSTTAAFRQVLQQFSAERPPEGFVGSDHPDQTRPALAPQPAREPSHV